MCVGRDLSKDGCTCLPSARDIVSALGLWHKRAPKRKYDVTTYMCSSGSPYTWVAVMSSHTCVSLVTNENQSSLEGVNVCA